MENAENQVAVNAVRTSVWASGLIPKPLHTFLSVVVAPTLQGATRDPEKFTDVDGAHTFLEVLFADL